MGGVVAKGGWRRTVRERKDTTGKLFFIIFPSEDFFCDFPWSTPVTYLYQSGYNFFFRVPFRSTLLEQL